MKDLTTVKEFETDIASPESKLTLVDFHASWCGPCKMMSPLIADIAETHKQQLNVVKVDADAFQSLAAEHGVRGIPTLLLFKDGKPVASKVGALSAKQLQAFVEPHLQAS